MLLRVCLLFAFVGLSSFIEQSESLPTSASDCNIWADGKNSLGPHQKGTGAAGFKMQLSATQYAPGQKITVTMAGVATQGFQIYAVDSKGSRVGPFDVSATNMKGLAQDQGCTSTDDNNPWTDGSTFNHNSDTNKPASMQFTWIGDPAAVGDVTFIGTVMPVKGPFYGGPTALSAKLTRDPTAAAPKPRGDAAAPPAAAPVAPAPVAPIAKPVGGGLDLSKVSDAIVVDPYKRQPLVPVAPVTGTPAIGGKPPAAGTSPIVAPVVGAPSTVISPSPVLLPVTTPGAGSNSNIIAPPPSGFNKDQVVGIFAIKEAPSRSTQNGIVYYVDQSSSVSITSTVAALMSLSAVVLALIF